MSGLNQADVAKALKKVRKAGKKKTKLQEKVDAAMLSMTKTSPIMTSDGHVDKKAQLKQKLRQMRIGRASQSIRAKRYNEGQEERKQEETQTQTRTRSQQRANRQRKLRKLQKKLGQVSQETFIASMERISKNRNAVENGQPSLYAHEEDMYRDMNIIDLFQKQMILGTKKEKAESTLTFDDDE